MLSLLPVLWVCLFWFLVAMDCLGFVADTD